MSSIMRYSDPELCDQLASHYVTGCMTSATRRRMEQLIHQEPEMRKAVDDWSDHMATLQLRLPEHQPPAEVWNRIQQAIQPSMLQSMQQQEQKTNRQPDLQRSYFGLKSFWDNLIALRFTAFTGLAATVFLSVWLVVYQDKAETLTASYLAPLSRNGAVELVVSGYWEPSPDQAQIFVQWSQTSNKTAKAKAFYLWAEDKVDHQLSYLGRFSSADRHWTLSKVQWKAMAHSSRLLANTEKQPPDLASADFIGPCLQLSSWKAES